MPQINLYLDKEEDDIINEFSKKWSISKADTIKLIIKDFPKKQNEVMLE